MSDYTVRVTREKEMGRLTFSSGSDYVSTTCWWKSGKKIREGRYRGCSATTMATKVNSKGKPREAIFVPNVVGFSEIFIHMGRNASWSDGCIVIPEDKMLRIYNAIKPKNAQNVTVVVRG